MIAFIQAKTLLYEGLQAFSEGNLSLAADKFSESLKLNPDSIPVLNHQTTTLIAQERWMIARETAERALSLDPRAVPAWINLGLIHRAQSRPAEALAAFARAVDIDPGATAAWSNKGATLHLLGHYAEAVACFDKALAIHPDFVDALVNKGVSLEAQQRRLPALACFERALAHHPDNALAWLNQGVTRQRLSQIELALACYARAIAIRPDYAEAWCNQGTALIASMRHEEALASYDHALAIKADDAEIWSNRGVALQHLRRYQEALDCYAKAIALDASCADAHWNASLSRLVQGDFERGWRDFEFRLQRKTSGGNRRFAAPRLQSLEGIAGKRILIWSEQGFGDTLQFCRFIPMLAACGAEVVYEVQAELKALLRPLPGCSLILPGADAGRIDYQCPQMSLPLLFATRLESIPLPQARLAPDTMLIRSWASRLGLTNITGGKPNIAIACSGDATHPDDALRSMPLDSFEPLLDRANLFLLQKEVRENDQPFLLAHPEIRFPGAVLEDFCDTAAIAQNMDLIVCVDTSLAHLAATLGKPVYVLLAWEPEWRWMLDRSDSPWYPTVSLFRQPAAGAWRQVIENVCAALDAQPA
jgi:tetratricopeptide (TPR) repeat protein